MRNKMPVFLLLGVLVCLFLFSTSTTSGHTVNPGAQIRCALGTQPDSVALNKEGIGRVSVGHCNISAKHRSLLSGMSFLLEGNSSAIAILKMQIPKESSQEIASLKLNGTLQYFTLERWVKIPAEKMVQFELFIGYEGEPGNVVPKVKVTSKVEETLIYSPGHGGYQKIDVAVDVFSYPGKKDTITLE